VINRLMLTCSAWSDGQHPKVATSGLKPEVRLEFIAGVVVIWLSYHRHIIRNWLLNWCSAWLTLPNNASFYLLALPDKLSIKPTTHHYSPHACMALQEDWPVHTYSILQRVATALQCCLLQFCFRV
jgi:hypothetical protein